MPHRAHLRARAAVVLAAAFLTVGHLTAQSADTALTRFFQSYLDEAFALRPLDATRLGDHRFDHLLDDVSAPARARWQEHTRHTLEALPREVDYARLSRDGQVDFEILRHELAKSLWLAENTRPFEEDPRVYNDYLSDSVFLLLAQSSLPRETNVAHVIARLAQMPRVITAARENLRTPPRTHTETAIRQNRGAIAFYERDLFALAGETRQLEALKQAAAPVVAA